MNVHIIEYLFAYKFKLLGNRRTRQDLLPNSLNL